MDPFGKSIQQRARSYVRNQATEMIQQGYREFTEEFKRRGGAQSQLDALEHSTQAVRAMAGFGGSVEDIMKMGTISLDLAQDILKGVPGFREDGVSEDKMRGYLKERGLSTSGSSLEVAARTVKEALKEISQGEQEQERVDPEVGKKIIQKRVEGFKHLY